MEVLISPTHETHHRLPIRLHLISFNLSPKYSCGSFENFLQKKLRKEFFRRNYFLSCEIFNKLISREIFGYSRLKQQLFFQTFYSQLLRILLAFVNNAGGEIDNFLITLIKLPTSLPSFRIFEQLLGLARVWRWNSQ